MMKVTLIPLDARDETFGPFDHIDRVSFTNAPTGRVPGHLPPPQLSMFHANGVIGVRLPLEPRGPYNLLVEQD